MVLFARGGEGAVGGAVVREEFEDGGVGAFGLAGVAGFGAAVAQIDLKGNVAPGGRR